MKMRVGHGYDVHRLVENRELIVGGVKIPHTTGLLGHSDADVLLHSIMDAILGAMAQGDIGKHFPDSDERYRGISSLSLLSHVHQLMKEKGFFIVNVDCTVIAQRPKLSPYIPQMRQNIATALHCELDAVNVKATTEEGLGFSGREEGIASHAVCLIEAAESV
jgi:2-C-methyl-D-erythritol 2,4-cyclodiphosphate synthase